MDQISSADLLNLVLAQRSSIDLQFQFWLTITFALIVASFIAGQRLTGKFRLLAATLYLLASAHIAARWIADGAAASEWLRVLAARGVVYEVPWIAAYLRMGVMLLGTLSALVFLLWHTGDPDAGPE
jgi:hypothetical protein